MTDLPRTRLFPARSALAFAAVGAALTVSACHRHGYADRDGRDRTLAVTTRLDCPEEQGDLRRTDQASDGRSCRYTGPDGQEVTLAYLALDGRSPQEALKPTEADLRSAVPAASTPEPGSLRAAADDHDDGDDDENRDSEAHGVAPAAPGAPTPPRPPEPPQVDSAWTMGSHAFDSEGDHERVRINLPFLHVDADGSGRAHVRTFGVDVNADGDAAVVRTPGGGAINAHHGGAEMRFGSVGRRRADLVYIVASDHAGPQGYRSAAYVAKGPASGPLVLAVTRSRNDSHDRRDGDVHDLKRLVNRNVRGAHQGVDFDID